MLLDHADFDVSSELRDSYDVVMRLNASDDPTPSVVDKRTELQDDQQDATYVTTAAVPKTVIIFSTAGEEAGVTLLGISEDGKGWDETYQPLYRFDTNNSDEERNTLSVQSLKKLGAMKSDPTQQSYCPPTGPQKELYAYLSTDEGATRIWNVVNSEDDDADIAPPEMVASVSALVSGPTEPSVQRAFTS